MRALVIYNPNSGKGSFSKKMDYIERNIKVKYSEVIHFVSNGIGSIEAFITIKDNTFDLIVVAGGDGTLNELVNGVMKLNKKPTIAYIPCGTVNDVGRMLKLRRGIKDLTKLILENEPVLMDASKCNDKYFLYAAAAGKFTNVSYKAPQKLKRKFGKMAYFLQSIKNLPVEEQIGMTVETENEVFKGKFYVMLALNSRRIAGFHVFRKHQTKLNDGIIDFTFCKYSRYHMSIFNLIGFFLLGDRWSNRVRTVSGSKIKITCENEAAFNVDGEFAFNSSLVNIEVIQKAIPIIVSKCVKKKYF